MASRAKLRADEGRAAVGATSPAAWRAPPTAAPPTAATPTAAPLSVRVLVLGALVLLAAYTGFIGWRLAHVQTAVADDASTAAGSALLAARAEAVAAGLSASAAGAAELLRRAPDAPLEAAEAAIRLSPVAKASAVVGASGVLATAGAAAQPDWTGAAAAATRSGRKAWVGAAPGGGRLLYAAATAATDEGPVQVIVAADVSDLADAGPDGSQVLADASGRVLSADGAGAGGAAGLKAAMGLAPAEALAAAAAVGERAGTLTNGRRARVSAATAADRALVAVTARPAAPSTQARRRGVESGLAVLLIPLAVALILALVLLRQIRRTETAHQARSETERRFRLAVEAARCGIWEWRLDDDTVFLSDVTGVMFGWGGGGVVAGEDLLARIAPEHRERVRQTLRSAQSFGAFDVSFRISRGTSGEGAWIDARGQAFGPHGPEGFSSVLGVALDVTAERTIEHRVQLAERRLHDAIESVSQGFILWDRHGRLVLCNTPYREFFLLEPRLLKPGAERRTVLKFAELAVKTWIPSPLGRRGVREVEMIDGRWLQLSERRTADGGLVMTAADITAIKQQDEARRLNEQALQRAVDTLEENRERLEALAEENAREKQSAESANRAKSEFLANMSHELRTPLNAINGFSEMMVSQMFGPLGDRRYAEYAQDILASGQHLLALINDILDMSKIEAGKMTLRMEPLDVVDVLEDVLRLMRNRAEAVGLTLVMAAEPGLPEVEADYRALKQVLLNLLSNALKFTPRGGRVTVRATMEAAREGAPARVVMAVIDTGIGIAEKDLDRLARPFEQVESQHAKTAQGTGLGLALTKSLVELLGGELTIRSSPGQGTTVGFTLTVLPAQPVRRAEAEAA